MHKKKFLVIGGAGYIGSHMVLALEDLGHQVTIFDNFSRGHFRGTDNTNIFEGCLLNLQDIDLCLKSQSFDMVMHFAAFAYVGESVEKPIDYFENNISGTINLLKAMKHNSLNKLVFSSTCAVYGEPAYTPIDEIHPKNPVNPYGKTKLEDEHLVEKYSKLNTEIIGLRYFNIFGKGQTLDYAGVITKFLDRINEGKAPIVFGKGSQIRDFIFVGDIVMANLLAMTSKISNLLVNIGTGKAITIVELANMMLNISKLDLKPIFKDSLDGDIQESHADNTLAVESFNWKPKNKNSKWRG